MSTANRILVGISGASGAVYAQRVIQLLAEADIEVHLMATPFGRRLLNEELGMECVDVDALSGGRADRVTLYRDRDVGAAIASGSFQHDGMIVVPCSSNTIGALASGITSNLLHRAAAVCLKERRRLVLGYREMPMSAIDAANINTLTNAGAIIAPLAPGFYMLPESIGDLVDFVAARLVDLLGVEHDLPVRWGEDDRSDAPS